MNSKNIVPVKDKTICMCCLKNKATNFYHISYRGYGSMFDGSRTKFQCCNECNNEDFKKWFDEEPCTNNSYYENYKFEDNIKELIHSLPLESQELFYNTFEQNEYTLDAQDWIDYQLDELPHERCKEYGLYSPEEIKAYQERFPNCVEVYKKVWEDGSSGCWCDNGAYGESDGTCSINISNECYMCTNYKPRNGDIKIINEVEEYYKNEKYRLEHMIEYATRRLEELEKNVCKYMDNYR